MLMATAEEEERREKFLLGGKRMERRKLHGKREGGMERSRGKAGSLPLSLALSAVSDSPRQILSGPEGRKKVGWIRNGNRRATRHGDVALSCLVCLRVSLLNLADILQGKGAKDVPLFQSRRVRSHKFVRVTQIYDTAAEDGRRI